MDDEDEVLLCLAESLSNNFVDLIGGVHHSIALFAPLE
jgi:hypothetical protein